MESTNPNPNPQDGSAVDTVFCQVTEKGLRKFKDKPVEELAQNLQEKLIPANAIEIGIEIEPQVCRICLDDKKSSSLISPCLCSGSCALVHLKCLELWLTKTLKKTDECEICQSAYKLKIMRVDPHFYQYVLQNPVVAVGGLNFFLTIVVFIGLAFNVAFFIKFIFAQKDRLVSAAISLGIFLLYCIYFGWIYGALQGRRSKWNEWKLEHQRLQLLPTDPENTNTDKIDEESIKLVLFDC